MNINRKIKIIREIKRLTQEDFANKIGLTRSGLSQIEIDRAMPTYQTLQQIAIVFSIDANILLNDDLSESDLRKILATETEMRKGYNTPSSEITVAAEPEGKYYRGIPLIPAEALAGQGVGEFTIHDRDVVQRYVVPEFSKADFLIPVKGSSMYPKYYPGDIVACMNVPKGKFIEWNKAYVLDTTHGIMLKKILKSAIEGQWILRSENTEYQDIEVNPDEDIRHISKVIGVIRMV